MLKAISTLASALVLSVLTVSSAQAAPVTFFDTISNGQNQYESTVTSNGGTFNTLTLSGLTSGSSWDMGDFTITAGSNRSISSSGANGLSGQSISGFNFDSSFLTFTFDNPINGFGFELGDWGTCCYPSSVFLSFDGGNRNTIGTMTQGSDNPNHGNPGYSSGQGVFIGAIDDSGLFNSITFSANQSGDFFRAGGTIYYSVNGIGSISPVPVPAAAWLFGSALLGFAGFKTRRKKLAKA